MKQALLAAGVCLLGVFVNYPLSAASITTQPLGTLSGVVTTSGALPNQAQVLEETFTLTTPSAFTAFTTSYGGGMNLDGTTAAAGGFQPMLSLFNSAGNFVAGQSVTSPVANIDSATGIAADAYLTDSNLAAGNYILVLTDWLNQQPPTATNLSDGFVDLGSAGSTFVDEQFNTRTAAYTLNISANSVSVATPEPGSIWLLAVPFGALLVFRKHRSSVA
jgi:hypothetical protein